MIAFGLLKVAEAFRGGAIKGCVFVLGFLGDFKGLCFVLKAEVVLLDFAVIGDRGKDVGGSEKDEDCDDLFHKTPCCHSFKQGRCRRGL